MIVEVLMPNENKLFADFSFFIKLKAIVAVKITITTMPYGWWTTLWINIAAANNTTINTFLKRLDFSILIFVIYMKVV